MPVDLSRPRTYDADTLHRILSNYFKVKPGTTGVDMLSQYYALAGKKGDKLKNKGDYFNFLIREFYNELKNKTYVPGELKKRWNARLAADAVFAAADDDDDDDDIPDVLPEKVVPLKSLASTSSGDDDKGFKAFTLSPQQVELMEKRREDPPPILPSERIQRGSGWISMMPPRPRPPPLPPIESLGWNPDYYTTVNWYRRAIDMGYPVGDDMVALVAAEDKDDRAALARNQARRAKSLEAHQAMLKAQRDQWEEDDKARKRAQKAAAKKFEDEADAEEKADRKARMVARAKEKHLERQRKRRAKKREEREKAKVVLPPTPSIVPLPSTPFVTLPTPPFVPSKKPGGKSKKKLVL